jgi:hypothetical protein
MEAWLRLLNGALQARAAGSSSPGLDHEPILIAGAVSSLGLLHREIGSRSFQAVPSNAFVPRNLIQTSLVIRYWSLFAAWILTAKRFELLDPTIRET